MINNIIKTDLNELFDKGHYAFPVVDIRLLEKKSVIEHLGIYSQNLIFLWLAISDDKEIKFEIYDPNEETGGVVNESVNESQDRDETNKNKLLWKRLTRLWTLVGNNSATAKLKEWVSVIEKTNDIMLMGKKSEVIHNFSDSANVSCNDFELLLSYFDNDYKFSQGQSTLEIIEKITQKKPEFTSLAIDVILHRFYDLYYVEGIKLMATLVKMDLSRRQQITFMKKLGQFKSQIDPYDLKNIILFISRDTIFVYGNNSQATIEYLKILFELKFFFPINQLVNPDILNETLYRLSKEIGFYEKDGPSLIFEFVKILNDFNKIYPLRRKFKMDILDESLHRLTKDRHYIIRESPFAAIEYLKLLNELKKTYPISKRIYNDLYRESLHLISKDILELAVDNPTLILEYLKILSEFRRDYLHLDEFPEKLIKRLLKDVVKEWRYIFDDNYINLLEFLKILVEFSSNYSIIEIIPADLIFEAFRYLPKDLIYLTKEKPKEAQEYLNVLKQIQLLYPMFDNIFKDIFSELIYRMDKEMEPDRRSDSQTILIYLELILIDSSHSFATKERLISPLIDSLSKISYGSKAYRRISALKASLLLIQYSAPSKFVEKLLEGYPKIKNIYLNTPEFASELIEANLELNNYERIN